MKKANIARMGASSCLLAPRDFSRRRVYQKGLAETCDVTRGGYQWTKHYPWIAESALKNRIKQFVIDGEAVKSPADTLYKTPRRLVSGEFRLRFVS